MSTTTDALVASDLDEARRRIRRAYDPELFRAAGGRLTEILTRYLEQAQARKLPVMNWADPRDNLARVRETLRPDARPAADSAALTARFGELVELALAHGHNLHNPHYVGHQVPAPVPVSGWFEALGALINNGMAIYEMGPFASACERAMVDALAATAGWAGRDYGGIVTHGASLANLTAFLVARSVALPRSWTEGVHTPGPLPMLVSQADAHYCMPRSAGILGLGTNQVVKAALDARRRMDPEQLDATLARLRGAGHPIIAVAASACATPIGAFDPLDAVADVCEKHGVWLHVDAAHGGGALLSVRHRHLLAGIERADSFTWDAHKMLFVPALCAFLFFKQRAHSYAAFQQNAPYLFDPSQPELMEFESGLRTVECTKRSMTFALWGVWTLFGPQLLADLVDVTFDLGTALYETLLESCDFVALHEPECNIVVFRHVPERLRDAPPTVVGEFQWALRKAVCASGRFYLVPTVFEGVPALRCTLINPLTTRRDLDELLDTLREFGAALLSGKEAASAERQMESPTSAVVAG